MSDYTSLISRTSYEIPTASRQSLQITNGALPILSRPTGTPKAPPGDEPLAMLAATILSPLDMILPMKHLFSGKLGDQRHECRCLWRTE